MHHWHFQNTKTKKTHHSPFLDHKLALQTDFPTLLQYAPTPTSTNGPDGTKSSSPLRGSVSSKIPNGIVDGNNLRSHSRSGNNGQNTRGDESVYSRCQSHSCYPSSCHRESCASSKQNSSSYSYGSIRQCSSTSS